MRIEDIQQFKEMSRDLSILMVDDEVNLTRDYLEIAQRFFTHTDIANSAMEAIKLFEKGKYDIIYTDLNMPGMNGIELIDAIKKIDQNQKFIVISASDDSDKLMQLLSLNVSGFIVKPFSISKFIHVSREQISILLQSQLLAKQTNQLQSDLIKVTQEKQAQENMLIQQSKLAQTGEMISMIAHQWRQPLSSITAQLSNLKTRLDLEMYADEENPFLALSTDFLNCFTQVEESVTFLSTTINDFRNFYRPNNDKNLFKICDAVKSVLSMLNLEKRQIEVTLKCGQYQDFEVHTFEGELKQVMMSILNNAADALMEHSINEPKVLILLDEKDENIILSITDNAGGIADDIIDHIFLPYFSTKNEKNGTGLGLHMAKTIMEQHVHGTLEVKNSAHFGGAEFTIKIPKTKDS